MLSEWRKLVSGVVGGGGPRMSKAGGTQPWKPLTPPKKAFCNTGAADPRREALGMGRLGDLVFWLHLVVLHLIILEMQKCLRRLLVKMKQKKKKYREWEDQIKSCFYLCCIALSLSRAKPELRTASSQSEKFFSLPLSSISSAFSSFSKFYCLRNACCDAQRFLKIASFPARTKYLSCYQSVDTSLWKSQTYELIWFSSENSKALSPSVGKNKDALHSAS